MPDATRLLRSCRVMYSVQRGPVRAARRCGTGAATRFLREALGHDSRRLRTSTACLRKTKLRSRLEVLPQAVDRDETGGNAGNGDEMELTEAEKKMIELDYIEDEDAVEEADLSTIDLPDVFSEPFEFEDDDAETIVTGTEAMDQGYMDRKDFIDHEALKKSQEFGKAMAVVADELKCKSIRLLDVHKKVYWTDMFLLVTAMSRTQLSAVLGKMEKVAQEQWGIEVLEAVTRRSEWECIDFGSLIVHAFSPRTREYYNLDEVYAKCEEIEVQYGPESPSPRWQESIKS